MAPSHRLYLFGKSALLATLTITVAACGGSGSQTVDNALNNVNTRYQDIAAGVRDAYQKVENKLTNNEKNTAEILKSIFLPEESLDKFLDKITPEGGKGGLYVGYFVEDNDGDANDVDIGATYFDIGNDAAASAYGQMSYQQKTCQNANVLSTERLSIKTDNAIGGVFSGTLDPAAKFDHTLLNFLRFDELKTTVSGMPFNGQYSRDNHDWHGQYSYQMGIDFGKKLSDNIDGCDVQYTLGAKGDFRVYPLTYRLGNLNVKLTGTGSTTHLNWTPPANTARTLVSQININQATTRGNGFVRSNIVSYGNTFTPLIDTTKTNYAFVVQAFDANNQLMGYEAIIEAL